MTRAILVCLTLVAVSPLAACHPAATVRDEAYFAGHPAERAQALAACRNDPGQPFGDPDCVNPLRADADAEHERVFHSAPPRAAGVNNPGHL